VGPLYNYTTQQPAINFKEINPLAGLVVEFCVERIFFTHESDEP